MIPAHPAIESTPRHRGWGCVRGRVAWLGTGIGMVIICCCGGAQGGVSVRLMFATTWAYVRHWHGVMGRWWRLWR